MERVGRAREVWRVLVERRQREAAAALRCRHCVTACSGPACAAAPPDTVCTVIYTCARPASYRSLRATEGRLAAASPTRGSATAHASLRRYPMASRVSARESVYRSRERLLWHSGFQRGLLSSAEDGARHGDDQGDQGHGGYVLPRQLHDAGSQQGRHHAHPRAGLAPHTAARSYCTARARCGNLAFPCVRAVVAAPSLSSGAEGSSLARDRAALHGARDAEPEAGAARGCRLLHRVVRVPGHALRQHQDPRARGRQRLHHRAQLHTVRRACSPSLPAQRTLIHLTQPPSDSKGGGVFWSAGELARPAGYAKARHGSESGCHQLSQAH
jgi:hypothetical protein